MIDERLNKDILDLIDTKEDKISDTGWIDITPSKGTWAVLRYRVIGKTVYVEGNASSFTWTGSGGDTFATNFLPSQYSPPIWSRHWLTRIAGTRIGLLFITTNGNIGIDYIVNINNGSNYTSAVGIDFQISYLLD